MQVIIITRTQSASADCQPYLSIFQSISVNSMRGLDFGWRREEGAGELTERCLDGGPDEDLRPCCDSVVSCNRHAYDECSCFGVLWEAVSFSCISWVWVLWREGGSGECNVQIRKP